jgi:hypothetical protein
MRRDRFTASSAVSSSQSDELILLDPRQQRGQEVVPSLEPGLQETRPGRFLPEVDQQMTAQPVGKP